MASIKKIDSKRKGGKPTYWVITTQNGRQKWHKAGPTYQEAKALRAKLENQMGQGLPVTLKKATVEQFVQKWLETQGHLAPNSRRIYGVWLRNHILPILGKRDLASISREDVERFVAKISEKLAPHSAKSVLSLLTKILGCAVEWGYLHSSPTKGVKPPKIRPRKVECMTPEEIRRFLEAAPDDYWRCFFTVAIFTGCRIGELLAMKWENLDWDKGQYFVRENYCYHQQIIREPKTESSYAPVHLSPVCLQVLREHQQHLEQNPPKEDLGLIFPTSTGHPHSPSNIVRRCFHPMLGKAGIRRIRLHDLRHTCASLLIAQGVNPRVVSNHLRHASVSITLDTYSHLFPDQARGASELLDQAIFGTGSAREGN